MEDGRGRFVVVCVNEEGRNEDVVVWESATRVKAEDRTRKNNKNSERKIAPSAGLPTSLCGLR